MKCVRVHCCKGGGVRRGGGGGGGEGFRRGGRGFAGGGVRGVAGAGYSHGLRPTSACSFSGHVAGSPVSPTPSILCQYRIPVICFCKLDKNAESWCTQVIFFCQLGKTMQKHCARKSFYSRKGKTMRAQKKLEGTEFFLSDAVLAKTHATGLKS